MGKYRLFLAFLALAAIFAVLSSCSDGTIEEPVIGGGTDSSSSEDNPGSSTITGSSSSNPGGSSSSGLGSSSSNVPGEPIINGQIFFSNIRETSEGNVYFIGDTPEWDYSIEFENLDAIECEPTYDIALVGGTGEAGKIKACASVSCGEFDIVNTLCSDEAIVAPNPALHCGWTNHTVQITKIDRVQTQTNINNNYDRCTGDITTNFEEVKENITLGSVSIVEAATTCESGEITTVCTGLLVTDRPEPIEVILPVFGGDVYDTKTGKKAYSILDQIEVSGGGFIFDPEDDVECGDYEYVLKMGGQELSLVNNRVAAPNVNVATSIKLIGKATCEGKEYDTDFESGEDVTAIIVPDPALSCSWQNSPITAGTTATPVLNVTNNYGRCNTAQATYSDGKTYPGIIASPGTVNISASLSCTKRSPADAACPVLAVNAATPAVTGENGFKFTNGYAGTSGKHYYYIGITPAYDPTIAISNSTAAACGDVSYATEGSTSAAGTYKVIAKATCNGAEKILASIEATVVANPTLSDCTINGSSGAVTVTEGTAVTLAVTSGNSYGRCAPVSFNIGTGLAAGTYTDIAYGSYTGIKAAWDCGDYSPVDVNCPNLTVKQANIPPPVFSGKAAFTGATTLTNNVWYYSGQTVAYNVSGVSTDREDCAVEAVFKDPSSAVDGNSKAKQIAASAEIQVCAKVECSEDESTYTSEETCVIAKIAPDVVLGGCVWVDENDQPLQVANDQVTVEKGAKVKAKADFSNSYGRCTDEAALQTINNYNPISNAQTALDCGQTYTPAQATCPTLVVNRPEPVASGSISFGDYSYSGGEGDVFFKGVNVAAKASGISITNALDADCDAVSYTIESGDVNTAGASINVCASATCNGKAKDLGIICGIAKIAEDPAISGCLWLDANDAELEFNGQGRLPALYNEETAKATAVYSYGYGRCTDNPVQKSITYATPVTGVTTNLSCPGYTLDQANCASLQLAPLIEPLLSGAPSFTNTEGDGIYSKGAVPAYSSDISVTNRNDCVVSYIKKVDGVIAGNFNTSAAGTLQVCAKATCSLDGAEVEACSGEVDVVADPTLAGACVWNPAALGAYGYVKSETVTPSGVSLSDNHGRCGAGTIAYSDASTAYPNKLPDIGVSGVQAKVTCTVNGSEVIYTSNCPAIANPKCSSADNYCSSGAGLSLITAGGKFSSNGTARCIHFTSIPGSNFNFNGTDNVYINNVRADNSCNNNNAETCLKNSSKYTEAPEGGWYIYAAANAWLDATVGTGFNACLTEEQVSLSCAIPQGGLTSMVNKPIDASAFLTCNEGSNPTGVSLSSSPAISLASPAQGTYTIASATAYCGSYLKNASCSNGTITVASEPTCTAYTAADGFSGTNKYCPGIAWSNIQWNVRPQAGSTGCFYVLDVTGDWGPQAVHRVNGTPFTSGNGTNRSAAANPKVDGGVYIYIDGSYSYMHNASNVIPGNPGNTPFCVDGLHGLSCTGLPADGSAGTAVAEPNVTCRSGDTPSGLNWTGAPAWTNPVQGAYNVSVSGTCGDSETLSVSCGTLNVAAAGSIVAINVGSGSVKLEANTVYNVTFTGSGSVVQCTENLTNDTVIGTYDGVELKLGDYNRLWMVNGQRVNPSGTHQVKLNQTLNCGRAW